METEITDTVQDMADLGSDILAEGISVDINIGREEVVAIIAISAATFVVANMTLGLIGVAAKRKLAKIRAEQEES